MSSEKQKAYRRAYYLAHREEELAKRKIYEADHPDKVKAWAKISNKRQYLKRKLKEYEDVCSL